MRRDLNCSPILTLGAFATVSAGDRPTYLGDNQRTGATAEQLPLPLRQAWLFSSSAVPRRTWTEPEGRIIEGKAMGDRVRCDDAAFQVAAVGHLGAVGPLLFRSGYTGFFDLLSDAGTRHFAGHRPGCWINAIPASGLSPAHAEPGAGDEPRSQVELRDRISAWGRFLHD